MTAAFRSPATGATLAARDPELLEDDDGRIWPAIDGIPYLRVGREALVAEAVAYLEAGDRDGALVLLLGDQDDWWTGPQPDPVALRTLVRERENLSLRAAMDLLSFGRVGHYFAHRWSDPTFMAGLGLIEAYWRPTRSAFELACGIGHYGRELMNHGVAYTGADVVFSKLWLARHWVLPGATTLVCFDAAAPWPIQDPSFDLVFCHDAFYFLEPKGPILSALRALAGANGRLAVGHIHNRGTSNLSAGRALSTEDLAQLFPDAAVFDDGELTRAVAEGRVPRSATIDKLKNVEAFALEDCPGAAASSVSGGLAVPRSSAPLRLNPLYQASGDALRIDWPSPRYEAEYGHLATYPTALDGEPAHDDREAVRRRILVDLPERW